LEVKIQFLVERSVDCIRRGDQEKTVAVGGSPARLPRWPCCWRRQAYSRPPLAHNTCQNVGCGSRWVSHDQADRPRRIGLRPRHARDDWQRGGARGQIQKISAGKFHDETLHSALILAARTTLPHFSVSSAMNFPKSAGEPANTAHPRSVRR